MAAIHAEVQWLSAYDLNLKAVGKVPGAITESRET